MLIIVNPTSGVGTAVQWGQRLCEELNRLGEPHTLSLTEYPGHATELVRAAYEAGERRFVSVGGDGTLHEVINGFGGYDVTFGILPAGSGNDMIRSLGIPPQPEEAIKAILSGKTANVDLPLYNDRHFMNYCGLGFDVTTLQRSDKLRGKVPRGMIYFLSLLITLFSFRFKHIRLKWENGSFDGEIFMINMANGRFYGNGLPFSPHSSVSDGILDVCLVKKLPRIVIPYLLVLFLMGKHERVTKYVQFLHVKEISLETDTTETMASDGNLFSASAVQFSAGEQIRVFTASGVK